METINIVENLLSLSTRIQIMVKRKFILGSEWGYCKFYTGTKNADILLVNVVLPLMCNLKKKGLIDKWFFIRYIDSSFHIRLRFHMSELINIEEVIRYIHSEFEPLIQCRSIDSLVYDTYARELERYGEDTYEITETIFYYDSLFLLQIIHSILNKKEKSGLRWMIALILVDDILDAINMDKTHRKIFAEYMRNSLRTEFGFTDKSTTVQFDKKYRYYRSEIEHFMKKEKIHDEIKKLLEARKEIMFKLLLSIQQNFTILAENYIPSIIHMTMNRLFISSNRIYEMIVYDFLFRYYNTILHKTNNETAYAK